MKTKNSLLTFAILGLSIVVPVSAAFADDVVVCAAVLPCDGAGGVAAEYASSPCGQEYQKYCSKKELDTVNNQLVEYSQVITRLQKENHSLKLQLLHARAGVR